MAWATIADVLAVTGQTVTQPQIDQAVALVEMHVGRLQADYPTATGRDARWLMLAVAYQTVATAAGGSTQAIDSLSIDGLSVSLGDSRSVGPDSLDPLAWRAARNLSWMRLTSQPVGLPRRSEGEWVHETIRFDEDSEGSAWTNWRPI